MSDRKFRVQMRVTRILDDMGSGERSLEVTISGWNPHRHVSIPNSVLPDGLMDNMEYSPGPNECTMYVYAHANLSAEVARDLDLSGPWELHRVRMEPAAKDDPNAFMGYNIETLDTQTFGDAS